MIKSIATCILFTLLWVNLAFARHPVLIVPGTNDVSANMVSGWGRNQGGRNQGQTLKSE